MSELEFTKFEQVNLKNHPVYNEKWVQKKISDDPSILGLGDLILLNEELIQPGGGRLDLLLYDSENEQRYEVEVQLGKVDESHIIRTIEYWDIERKRYPQYDHIAVIVAEEITGRFLNIISLFNGHIPLIAIQMKTLQCGQKITIDCTKILDRIELGGPEPPPPPADRSYWEKKASPATVTIADEILKLIHTFAPNFALNYNKGYIGLMENDRANNFAYFHPKKKFLRLSIKLRKSEQFESQLDEAGLEMISYSKSGRYKIRLYKEDVEKNKDLLTEALRESYGKATE
ncbi:MAG TPA: hypothetical protein DIU00_17480 [Phycisphaerales bacterium]|nr:hypothetical protein [Phycisphaerales bacterium]